MTATTPPARTVSSSATTFTAAAIHDGLLPGLWVKEALDWLHHVLVPEFKVRTLSWSFQQLERLDVRAMALHAAASAQMIIIAGGEDTLLPGHVERWLDDCVSEADTRNLVLVALPEEKSHRWTRGQEPRFVQTVRQFALRWHADFMSGAEFEQMVTPHFVRQHFFPPQPSFSGPSGRRPSLVFDAMPRFYGIND